MWIADWNVLNAYMSAVQAQNLLWSQTYKIKWICSVGYFYNYFFPLPPFHFLKGEGFSQIIFELFG